MKSALHLADLALQLLYFMAQLSDSAAQCAVDVRKSVVKRGSKLPVPVFEKGRLMFECFSDIGRLVCRGSFCIVLSNNCGLGLRHGSGGRLGGRRGRG